MSRFKSSCRACHHVHGNNEPACNHFEVQNGNIKLREIINPSHQHAMGAFSGFDYNYGKDYEYTQEIRCRCAFYSPTDNLEYMEWKYDESIR